MGIASAPILQNPLLVAVFLFRQSIIFKIIKYSILNFNGLLVKNTLANRKRTLIITLEIIGIIQISYLLSNLKIENVKSNKIKKIIIPTLLKVLTLEK